MLNFTQWLLIFLSTTSLGSVGAILHAPDPAFAWRREFGRVEITELEDDELYTISPTHDWRGLA